MIFFSKYFLSLFSKPQCAEVIRYVHNHRIRWIRFPHCPIRRVHHQSTIRFRPAWYLKVMAERLYIFFQNRYTTQKLKLIYTWGWTKLIIFIEISPANIFLRHIFESVLYEKKLLVAILMSKKFHFYDILTTINIKS